MSRTDSHAPLNVRITRREVAARAVHRCAGRDCDLPDLVAGKSGRRGATCYWQSFFTGHGVCSCWMCHWWTRPQERRAAMRAGLRGQVREWNAGDVEAG